MLLFQNRFDFYLSFKTWLAQLNILMNLLIRLFIDGKTKKVLAYYAIYSLYIYVSTHLVNFLFNDNIRGLKGIFLVSQFTKNHSQAAIYAIVEGRELFITGIARIIQKQYYRYSLRAQRAGDYHAAIISCCLTTLPSSNTTRWLAYSATAGS